MLIFIRKKTCFIAFFIVSTIAFIFWFSVKPRAVHVTNEISVQGYVAIVIDDFGNNGDGTQEILGLDIPITAAVMPFMPFSVDDAEAAHKAGLEVIMHVPMEPVHGKRSWLGPKGITDDLSEQEVEGRIVEGLNQIRWAVGMNNHMGSKAMQNERIVRKILEMSKERELYFLDSKTTEYSSAPKLAKEIEIPLYIRDVFLDNVKDVRQIEKKLEELGEIALKKGYAIGIGHVGPEGGKVTAAAIQSMAPKLKEKGIQFTTISKLHMMIEEKEEMKNQ